MDLFRQLEREAREAGRGLWAEDSTAVQPSEGTYWLNTKTNVLHNSTCRWYGNTAEGYYTEEVLGKDCGLCGGAHRQDTIQTTKQSTSDEDVIVYVTKTGSKYHRAGCKYLKKSQIPMKLSEAKKRYSPCSACNPPR